MTTDTKMIERRLRQYALPDPPDERLQTPVQKLCGVAADALEELQVQLEAAEKKGEKVTCGLGNAMRVLSDAMADRDGWRDEAQEILGWQEAMKDD